MSVDPETRLAQLSVGLPVDLYLYHQIETRNMTWLERYLHVALRHRHRGREWFELYREHILELRTVKVANSPEDLPDWIVALWQWNESPSIQRYFYRWRARPGLLNAHFRQAEASFGPLPKPPRRGEVNPPPLLPDPPLPTCDPDAPAPKPAAQKAAPRTRKPRKSAG